MEPMNCVVKLSADACEIWNGEQFQSIDQPEVAAVLGMKPEQVKLNMLFAGGSFGRRANPHADYLVEATQIAKAIGGRAPVKLVWTREDDMRAGHYRPMYYHTLKAGLDAQGSLIAWQHRIVGQSILAGTAFEGMMVKEGIDATSGAGAASPCTSRSTRWSRRWLKSPSSATAPGAWTASCAPWTAAWR